MTPATDPSSTPPRDTSAAAQSIAAGLVDLLDLLRVIGEAVDGYRADMAARGYSPIAAEEGAMALHGYLLAQAFSGAGKGTGG